MEITIEPATAARHDATESLTRDAFWDLYRPGCVEHLILHRLRRSGSHVPALDLVAVAGGRVVGHLIATRAAVRDAASGDEEVLCVGPVSAAPSLQRRGVGSALMERCIAEARRLGHRGMILFGDPAYYHRFGFRNAAAYGITTKTGDNMEPFMALELRPGALADVTGRFYEDDAFEVDDDAVAGFDARFPRREKGEAKRPIG